MTAGNKLMYITSGQLNEITRKYFEKIYSTAVAIGKVAINPENANTNGIMIINYVFYL